MPKHWKTLVPEDRAAVVVMMEEQREQAEVQ